MTMYWLDNAVRHSYAAVIQPLFSTSTLPSNSGCGRDPEYEEAVVSNTCGTLFVVGFQIEKMLGKQ